MNRKDKRKIVSEEILAMWLCDVLHVAFRKHPCIALKCFSTPAKGEHVTPGYPQMLAGKMLVILTICMGS